MGEHPSGFLADYKRKPICGVHAVALCAGVSFNEAWLMLRAHMPKGRARFGGRTFHEQRISALRAFDVKFTELRLERPFTLREWIEARGCENVLYMLDVTGHTMTFKDGILSDQGGFVRYVDHWALRKRLRRATIIQRRRGGGLVDGRSSEGQQTHAER